MCVLQWGVGLYPLLAACCGLESLQGVVPLCVDVLTVAGVQGMPEFSAYSASKHALVGLMRSAAAECAPKGLRINCINPATTGVCVSVAQQ